MKLSHSHAVFMMVLVTLMWSIAGVTTRHLESAHSFEITFWRSAFTVLSLLVILPLLQGRVVFTKIRQGGTALWLSGICWSVMFTAFMVALSMSPVANVLVTMALGPLFTALLARIFIGHRLPLRTWVAIAVAGVGIATMYGTQLSLAGDSGQWVGTLVALCVPIAGAVNWTVVQRSHAKGQDVDLVPSVLVGAILSTALTLPLALPFQATPHDVGLLAMLGAVQLAIPCVLSVWCARVLKAPEVSLLQLLEVLFGIVLVWLGAGEAPAQSVLLGGSLVLGALVANELLGWWQRKSLV
ncbi:drug/metabolite transporter (DMT)-like permease [Rhodoferax ferrireducens]|uniref:Drug/metabolite transporter (DMT)-like permease n=1 Tax=Rhodoferax ferrireducens TaxID=192843 RepID=A0ABU2C6H1_9BURK|nr:DMT family transporter [Rhodoferax ferrireducens]MDR7376931.1 drug/metabolite transporter (DMT)-like permease [Rhodoferax ferrireducens]